MSVVHAGTGIFDWVEYSVFSTMLILSMLIGVYYGWFKKQDTVAEYMLGGKKMNIFPVTMSLIFSHVSGVTLLGIPAEVYSYGTQYFSVVFSFIIVYFIVAYFYLPVAFSLQLNSLFEYLELRFSKKTRTITSFIYSLSLFLFIPVVVYVPALAFNEVTGVSVHVIAMVVSIVCIFYTSLGGLRAVLWTDALQSVFTLGSIVFICITGFVKIGSISEVWRINKEGHRLEFFNMNPSPFERNTFWSMTIGNTFHWIAILAVNPGSVQRFISVPNIRQAKVVLLGSCIGCFVVKALSAVMGLLLFAKYRDCDPVATKMVRKAGQLMPLYVTEISQDFPGLLGLFISGVVSAALSTMSACMNTVAWTIYEDFSYLFGGEKWSDHRQNVTMKIICLVLGVVFTALVLVVEKLGSLFQMAQSLSGVTSGALIGVFSLGLFFPRANSTGAIIGSLSSVLVMAFISLGSQLYIAEGLLKFPVKETRVDGCPANFTENLGFNASALVGTYQGVGSLVVADPSVPLIFQLSYLYYTLAGTLVTLAVGMFVSYFTEQPPLDHLDHRLFTPLVRRFLPKKQELKAHSEEYKLVNTEIPLQDIIKDNSPDNTSIKLTNNN